MKIKLPNQNHFKEKRKVFQNKSTNFFKGNNSKSGKEFSLSDKERIVIEGQGGKLSIDEICLREGITVAVFHKWTQEFLVDELKDQNVSNPIKKSFSDDERYRIVLEGNNGTHSIAEICKNENITQDEFLRWSGEFLQIREKRLFREGTKDYHTLKIKELIENLVGEEILEYFENFIDVTAKETIVISNHHKCTNDKLLKNKKNLVCLSRINDIKNINKHFELINSKLPQGGVFIGCLDSLTTRREKINKNGIPFLNNLYFGYEFISKRVLPKLGFTKFNIAKGGDCLISKAEGLGRLVKSGFNIIDEKTINGLVYFVVKKVNKPIVDLKPSFGLIYKSPRLSKEGKIIMVYKIRTMHPYSEYLQDYMVKANGYAKTGKLANDFRIPVWGKFIRRYWFDEIPQIINILKGELRLVGIRPVSKSYFQDLPKEMQKLRLTQKPGWIPPYIALNKDGGVMSVLQAERVYIEERIKYPYSTDIKYFFKAIYNVVFKHLRSS